VVNIYRPYENRVEFWEGITIFVFGFTIALRILEFQRFRQVLYSSSRNKKMRKKYIMLYSFWEELLAYVISRKEIVIVGGDLNFTTSRVEI